MIQYIPANSPQIRRARPCLTPADLVARIAAKMRARRRFTEAEGLCNRARRLINEARSMRDFVMPTSEQLIDEGAELLKSAQADLRRIAGRKCMEWHTAKDAEEAAKALLIIGRGLRREERGRL